MADHTDVLRGINRVPHVQYPVLTPNIQGFHDAVRLPTSHSACNPQTSTCTCHMVAFCVQILHWGKCEPSWSRVLLFQTPLKVAAGATEVAVFGSASETFSQRNINCSIDESMLRFVEVISAAKERQIPVRGWVLPMNWHWCQHLRNDEKWKILLSLSIGRS